MSGEMIMVEDRKREWEERWERIRDRKETENTSI